MAGQRDEDIDYSDIPPIREIPASAVRGRFYRGHAIYLTDELHAYLSTIAVRRGVSLDELEQCAEQGSRHCGSLEVSCVRGLMVYETPGRRFLNMLHFDVQLIGGIVPLPST